jgi:hypothetical protein
MGHPSAYYLNIESSIGSKGIFYFKNLKN